MAWTSNPSMIMQRPHSAKTTNWGTVNRLRSMISTTFMVLRLMFGVPTWLIGGGCEMDLAGLGAFAEQGLVGRDEIRIALSQLRVADAAGAAHVVVGEADGVEPHFACDPFVPVQALCRGALEIGGGRPAH